MPCLSCFRWGVGNFMRMAQPFWTQSPNPNGTTLMKDSSLLRIHPGSISCFIFFLAAGLSAKAALVTESFDGYGAATSASACPCARDSLLRTRSSGFRHESTALREVKGQPAQAGIPARRP